MLISFDAITRFIASIDNAVIPGITTFSYFLDMYAPLFLVLPLLYMAFIFAKTFYLKHVMGEKTDIWQVMGRERWLIRLILAMLLALIICFAIKYIVQIPRPCMLDPAYNKIYCPTAPDFSFPSGHTAITSAFLASQVGAPAFLPFFVINLLMGFSRINLGVHFLNDVLAGFVVGFFSYDIINRLISSGTLSLSKPMHPNAKFEFRRQLLHMFVGIVLIILVLASTYFYGRNGQIYVEFLVFIILQVMLFVINDRMRMKEGPISHVLFKMFERTGVSPGYGAFWYGMGTLLLFVFINDINFLIASIIALGIGDGMATIVGQRGRMHNPINKDKTIEGTLAFFASVALLAFPFIGPLSLVLALITAFIESLPQKFDDNFTIPLVCILLFLATSSPVQ